MQYLIGVYLINGCKNDVTTFVDVSVFDISNHKYLLRAPGTNKITANSALINTQKILRIAKQESFTAAIDHLTEDLQAELESFKQRNKQDKSVEISYRPSFSGGGAISWLSASLLIAMIFNALCRPSLFNTYKYYWRYSPDPRFKK